MSPAKLVITFAQETIIHVLTVIGLDQPLIGNILIHRTQLGGHIAGGG